ncbi:hypothetical protein D3C71_1456290 [compost metagenome]
MFTLLVAVTSPVNDEIPSTEIAPPTITLLSALIVPVLFKVPLTIRFFPIVALLVVVTSPVRVLVPLTIKFLPADISLPAEISFVTVNDEKVGIIVLIFCW